ncbi:hypothetical protein [Shimia biformata]|uniref:hypothetical protein n=1 Tax=Shimia biformata TaxID=1294299 RepID=UPI00195247A9|nr:hypothetical protein [Shimia biformata]
MKQRKIPRAVAARFARPIWLMTALGFFSICALATGAKADGDRFKMMKTLFEANAQPIQSAGVAVYEDGSGRLPYTSPRTDALIGITLNSPNSMEVHVHHTNSTHPNLVDTFEVMASSNPDTADDYWRVLQSVKACASTNRCQFSNEINRALEDLASDLDGNETHLLVTLHPVFLGQTDNNRKLELLVIDQPDATLGFWQTGVKAPRKTATSGYFVFAIGK